MVVVVLLRNVSSFRARIFKRFGSPGINSKESIPPAYVAWRAGYVKEGFTVGV
jgi:hypothetical protein